MHTKFHEARDARAEEVARQKEERVAAKAAQAKRREEAAVEKAAEKASRERERVRQDVSFLPARRQSKFFVKPASLSGLTITARVSSARQISPHFLLISLKVTALYADLKTPGIARFTAN